MAYLRQRTRAEAQNLSQNYAVDINPSSEEFKPSPSCLTLTMTRIRKFIHRKAGRKVPFLISQAFTLTGYGLTFFTKPMVACAGAVLNAVSTPFSHFTEHLEHEEEREKLAELASKLETLQREHRYTIYTVPVALPARNYGLQTVWNCNDYFMPFSSFVFSWACDVLVWINNCQSGKKEIEVLTYLAPALGIIGIICHIVSENRIRANIRERQEQYYTAIHRSYEGIIYRAYGQNTQLTQQLTLLQSTNRELANRADAIEGELDLTPALEGKAERRGMGRILQAQPAPPATFTL